MKRTGKVFVVLAIVCALLVGTAVTAFAAEPPQQGDRERSAKALTRLFIRYDSDNLDTYLALKAEHREFHEGRKGIGAETKEKAAAELQALIDALIDGDMTLEEARAAFAENRDKVETFREEVKAIADAKKADNEQTKEQLQDVRAQIKEALDAGEVDEELMASLLGQTLALLEQHLQNDYDYAEQFDALTEEYYPE